MSKSQAQSQVRIDLTDSEARAFLLAQRSILAVQNESHRVQQQAQQAIAQLTQKEQAAQKAYAELVAKAQLEHDCVGVQLDSDGFFFLRPATASNSPIKVDPA